MRVLLSGYYGFGNLGDEALLEVIVDGMRRRFPRVELEVLSATPTATARTYDVAATPRWEWRAVREAVGRADVVLSGGGGLLQNATSTRSLLYYAAVLREATAAKRKTMIFAQSIGPLDVFGRFIVSRFCRSVTRATVRDERSLRTLQGLLPKTPVERTADPVFLYDVSPDDLDLGAEGLGPESGRYAIFSLRKSSGSKELLAIVRRAADRLSDRHGIRVAFLPLGGSPDAEVSTDAIRQCSSAPVLLPACPLSRAAAILRGAYVVVGMRLHALILAARFSVPFLALAYDPKVSALCEDLAYPLPPLWSPGQTRTDAEIDAAVDALVERRAELAEHLSHRLDVVRASAERNFDVLGELLGE